MSILSCGMAKEATWLRDAAALSSFLDSEPSADKIIAFSADFSRLSRHLEPQIRSQLSECAVRSAVLDAGLALSDDSVGHLVFERWAVPALPAVGFWRGTTLLGVMEVAPGGGKQLQEALKVYQSGGNPIQKPSRPTRPRTPTEKPLLLFIAGDRASVGKTSTCLGILAKILSEGIYQVRLWAENRKKKKIRGSATDAPGQAHEIAYIKPATQNEKPQPVTRFCEAVGIEAVGVGPIVFYKGFTRAFLDGEVEGGASGLLASAALAVDELGKNKRLVVVDGVGYPAVGSICGVSNADIAEAIGAAVLLVGKSGVGDAVDSFNLNAAYFEKRSIPVIGGIFNKLDTQGYYSLENCAAAVGSYFRQFRPLQSIYGFVPKVDVPDEAVVDALSPLFKGPFERLRQQDSKEDALKLARGLLAGQVIMEHLDARHLVEDLLLTRRKAAQPRLRAASEDRMDIEVAPRQKRVAPAPTRKAKRARTRAEIEAEALEKGARSGG
eukprot:scaffold5039_cov255-Pinguiococcus_pyrenoidosus.AAC.4